MIGKRGVVTVAVLVGSLLGPIGCGSKKNSTMEPSVEPTLEASEPQTDEGRIEQLGQAIDAFADARKGLRGHADEQARRDLAEALAKLQHVLTLLKGQQAGGAFRQQVRIIERAGDTLTSGSQTAPEPTINAAIRAAENALSTMAADTFGQDEQLKASLDGLRQRVRGLDAVRGPIHGFETAKALDEIGGIAQRMAETLQQRMPQPQPTTAPVSPAAAPATDPA